MRRILSWNMFKHFRITLYIENSWERGDKHIKVDLAKIHNAIIQDYRMCQVYQLRYHYDCIRHAQQILRYALSNSLYD